MTAPDNRATLYTLRGTGGALAQAALLGNSVGNYDVMVGQEVDPTRWRVVEIGYIGGTINLCNDSTVADGVTKLVDAINSRPGQFAFVGMSQGAIVCSEVYKRIKDPAGDLHGRNADFVGGVMFGNPLREAGHTIPGGTNPGGHGVAPAGERLAGSEARWWEFADPEDVFAVVGDDTLGQDQTRAYEFIMTNWAGAGALDGFLTQMSEWATMTAESQAHALAMFELLQKLIPSAISLVGLFDPDINTFGHLRYHLPYEGLAGNTDSAVVLGANYLDTLVEPGYTPPEPVAPVSAGGIYGGPTNPKTLDDQFTSELRMHLLERRWAYMHRKVKQPLIRVWDKDFNFIARVDGLAEKWDWEEIASEDGEAHVTFTGKNTDWLREIVAYQIDDDEDVHLTIDPDPDNPTDFYTRWGGKVLTIEGEDNAGEASSFVLNCISNRRHLSSIYLAATPITPMEFQPLKMFLWGGPTCSTAAFSTFINCFRLYTLNGFYPIPRNIFAPETWLENVSPLNWPVQVMPVMPLFDQSRWCTVAARWKDAHTVLSPPMRDAGVICRAYTWLPGDPAPYTIFGPLAELLKPTRACVILSFENKSGVTGPTGTMLDGALNLFAATLDDLITETLIPLDTDRDTETDPFFRKLLLVAPKKPPFVYRDVGYGNVRRAKWVIHKSQATDIIVGGKSPQWVNMAITFAIRYAISQLAQVVLGMEAPGAEGLDNLYQGQLDDVFLAFMRFTNPLRSAKTGPYAFREYHHQGHGSAYTVNAIQDIAAGEHEMKAYRSMRFDVGEGQPYVYGQDFLLGDRVQAEIRGIVYTDQIYAVKGEGDRTSPGRPEVSFGDDSREEDPIARGFRTISNVANFAGLLAGSGDMF